jgi:hypothetical protein
MNKRALNLSHDFFFYLGARTGNFDLHGTVFDVPARICKRE